jgi:hypothetical protein
MEAAPKKGDTYDQENAPGIAEDEATVTSLNGKATLEKFGTLSNLLVTLDLNPLERDPVTNELAAQENKYYSNLAGFHGEVFAQTYELDEETHKYVLAETEQLFSVTPAGGTTQLVQAMAGFGATQSTSSPLTTSAPDDQASQNALAAPGHHHT